MNDLEDFLVRFDNLHRRAPHLAKPWGANMTRNELGLLTPDEQREYDRLRIALRDLKAQAMLVSKRRRLLEQRARYRWNVQRERASICCELEEHHPA